MKGNFNPNSKTSKACGKIKILSLIIYLERSSVH